MTKWTFTGREKLSIDAALAVKEELEEIERLLKQLEDGFVRQQKINELNYVRQAARY